MAAAIEKEMGVNPELIESGGGLFEVKASGTLLFSKKATGRFPEHHEVLEQLRKLK